MIVVIGGAKTLSASYQICIIRVQFEFQVLVSPSHMLSESLSAQTNSAQLRTFHSQNAPGDQSRALTCRTAKREAFSESKKRKKQKETDNKNPSRRLKQKYAES